MATPEQRAAVLADIAAGVPQRAAAARHGVPPGTVAYWCARARSHGGAPSAARRFAPVRGGKGDGETGEGGSGGGVAPPAPVQAKVSRATRAGQVSAADLPFDARRMLREAVTKGLTYLSDGPAGDPKGWAQAARGLKEILTQTPDILTFEERTGARDASEDRAELEAAFEMDPGAPVELRAVRGGGG